MRKLFKLTPFHQVTSWLVDAPDQPLRRKPPSDSTYKRRRNKRPNKGGTAGNSRRGGGGGPTTAKNELYVMGQDGRPLSQYHNNQHINLQGGPTGFNTGN